MKIPWYIHTGIAFIFVLGALFVWAGIQMYRLRERSSKWDRVQAHVAFITRKSPSTAGDVGPASGRNVNPLSFAYKAQYTFTYKGREWQGNRATINGKSYTQKADYLNKLIEDHENYGEWSPVLAWVNPDNPNESILFRENVNDRIWGAVIGFGVMLLSGVFLGFSIYRGLRR